MTNDTRTCASCGSNFTDQELECPECGAKWSEPMNEDKADGSQAPVTSGRSKSAAGLVVMIALALAVISSGIWYLGGLGESEYDKERKRTLANLKQIAAAVMSYQADWDGYYPPQFSSMRDLRSALSPYLTDETEDQTEGNSPPEEDEPEGNEDGPGDQEEPKTVFDTTNPSGGGFRLNGYLSGIGAADLGDKGRTILIYDSEPWPDGGWCIAFTDGSVRFVSDKSDLVMAPFGF